MKRIAVDLAKSVYQVAESVRVGQVSQRRRLNREAFRRYIQEQAEPVEWVMEACGTAHYWGRLAQSLGQRVVLLHPRYVRPYRRRNKTDRNDCDAILEAARCQGIHPVPVKSHAQQQVQQLHGLRETWKKSRTQRINLLCGILREVGIEAPAATQAFIRAAHDQLSAWLGMTPREYSSGNSRKLGHISRQGNTYVRTLLIHGARAALLAAQRCQANTPERLTQLQRWAVATLQRIGHNKAAVALANKLVRVWCHERRFNGNWQSRLPA